VAAIADWFAQVCATIAYHFAASKSDKNDSAVARHKVLMCAPSNVAADALCAKVVRTGAKVLRVYSTKSEHRASEDVVDFALHALVAGNARKRGEMHWAFDILAMKMKK
jgi:hypothetical protein